MRKLLLLCLLALGAGAGDDKDLLRIAVEAKLKVGDLLREKGDLAGALKAYKEAALLWERKGAKNSVFTEDVPDKKSDKPFTGDKPWIKEKEPKLRRVSRRNLRASGGTGRTVTAVDLGLQWLAKHQDVDTGRWDSDEFSKHDPAGDKCSGAGGPLYDVGATGLATLAFLGAGYTDRGSEKENPYAKTVRQGLRFLMVSQGDDGCFGSRVTMHYMYNHAMATVAMCEAYWMTRNPRYREPARRGVEFILKSRNPYMAWRYGVRPGENDTSVTAWCVMALKAARYAGLDVPADAFSGALAWLDKVTDPKTGIAGYNMFGGAAARPEGMQDKFPPEKSQSMTAAATLTRIFCGQNPVGSDLLRKSADRCLEHPPKWNPDDGSIDMYYWFFGTYALFQVGGKHWKDWNNAMKEAIVKNQHPMGSGARAGSWDPIGPWQSDGGRIYSTALMTMCLEVYYRYERAPRK